MTRYNSTRFQLYFSIAMAVLSVGVARAQVADRITGPVDAAQTQTLAHHLPMWASPANDAGALPPDSPLGNLTVVLARSPEQEAAFEQLLSDQQNPASPSYHKWLTPAEIGDRFGLSDNDLAAITGWLQSQGLRVNWVAPSRIFIGFSGTAASVGRAFGTELHYYQVHGEQRISIASDPQIPAALAPAIKAIRGLYTINERPFHFIKPVKADTPDLTISSSTHFLAPGDFATIYDLPASLTGAGATIGIVAESRTDSADFDNFKSLSSSSFSDPTEIVPTAYGAVDPGPAFTAPASCNTQSQCNLVDAQGEATLDVERAGSVAPGASLLLVVASAASGGIEDDAMYMVGTTPVPVQVMSISFGACESAVGASGVDFWDSLFQQAAGEGISVFVSSGDSGASGCDIAFQTPPATPEANSPNYICSSSYATCVGGTEFNDLSNPSAYWNSGNGANLASALGYIPEGAWNEPLASGSSPEVASSGGGVSAYIITPTWQTGAGVPSPSGRYTPDVAFSAAGHDGYFGCFAAGNGSCVSGGGGAPFVAFSGTSAAAPGMAGVAALLDQRSGIAEGNLNPEIYSLAASTPAAFHQVSVASSGVSNCNVGTPSMCNNSIPGPSGLTGGQAGYQLGATGGYSEVSGLGSLDVSQFINSYANTGGSGNAPTVTVSAPPSITVTESASVKITVTGSSGVLPTGTVTLASGPYMSAATPLSIPGTNSESAFIIIPSNALAIGTETLTATYTSNSSTYSSATGTTTMVVTSALPTPTITWAAPAPIVYGTKLSATQLDATASVPGTFIYSPAAGAVLTAGPQTLEASFTPNDTTDYSDANATVPLTVSKATPVLTWATPAAVPVGTVLGATQLSASANVPGTFTYTPISGTVMSSPGNFQLSVTFAPTDSTDYTIASANVTLSVTAVTSAPSITTSAASSITGSSATLGGQATPNGADTNVSFLYGTSSTLSGATQTTAQDIGAGYIGVSFTSGATSLSPNTTYYFQAVAQNSFGTTKGSIQSFTTSGAPTFTLNGGSVTVAKGAISGNTATVTVAPAGGFTGTVALSATVTNSPTGAQNLPTLTWSPSNQVSVTGTGNATATLVIATTPATAAENERPVNPRGSFYSAGGAALACIAFFWIPARRRDWRRLLGMVALAVALTFGAISCGGNMNTGTSGTGNPGTTSGPYTITVTGSSGSISATPATINLTVQ